ncbi:aspartyl/asparaginyl beta-hydroxylase isoform X4 [Vanessa cardui]|uniref:aspartyl/asparaginyl beta-hydroxylase isoform X4 n=1 Tax=Vanessa cardui TaxID=171605 RepID=UPI001F1458D6|nr:aspartyl/asparaginyl beta-hydroxylase isoform X4 [Vanessa cardui]
MSGDVQPRRRKDKKKKKDDLGVEEPRGTAATLGEGDVFMHSQHDHGTGGHWCAKIIFFSLLAVLITLVGLIILENRGLTELEANSVESRYSGVLEGWLEDTADDDHHDEHTLELKHPDDDIEEHVESDLEDEEEHDLDEDDEEHEDEDDEEHDDEDDEEHEDEEDEIADSNEADGDEEEQQDETHENEDNNDESVENLDETDDEEVDEKIAYSRYSYDDQKYNVVDNDDDDDNDDEQVSRESQEIEEDDDKISKEIDDDQNDNDSDEEDNQDEQDDEDEQDNDENYVYGRNEKDESAELDEENQEQDDDEADDEDEIEKIEREFNDDDEGSEEVPLKSTLHDKEDEDVSKEDATQEEKEDDEDFLETDDDEPPVERITTPPAGKPFVEIEEETIVKPIDTLAEEEEYERKQEELRREEAQASHKEGGNSIEDEWPGEPSQTYWREQLDTAEEELRQRAWAACERRAAAGALADSARARWLVARALDGAAEARRDNRLLSRAIAAYIHLLKMNERLSDAKLLEVARRAIDRIQFRGTYLSAEPIYRLLIRRFPHDVNHRNNLTVTFLMANRADLASEVLQDTLRLWPNDRVALAHHGFVMKNHYNNLEEAVVYLQRALEGDAGPPDAARFYYHLGDALLQLGRPRAAQRVHARAAALGHFLSAAQRSLYNVPRLRARPWWPVEDTPYAGLARALESSWRDVLREAEEAGAAYEREKEGLMERGEWSQLELFVRGREVGGRCARAPVTCALVRAEPAAAGCRRGQVKFSAMRAGTHVRAHVGPTNCRLRLHLALSNTDGTYIRVHNETRQWRVGKTFIFDDSFEHEVWHNGTGTRIVLIVDLWHPDLTAAERRQLPAI